jgi:hypothetical protein
MPRIGLRCSSNRTKRSSCRNRNHQDFTHNLLPSVHLQPHSPENQTCPCEQGFASANYKCFIPYIDGQTLSRRAGPSQINEKWPLFPLAVLSRLTAAKPLSI